MAYKMTNHYENIYSELSVGIIDLSDKQKTVTLIVSHPASHH